jgi:hypothetical protein
MGDWLQVVCNRRPRVLLRKQKIFVFKDHITLDVKSAIHAVNTDLVVIPHSTDLKTTIFWDITLYGIEEVY